MEQTPYEKIPKDHLILRDYLAAERTVLANERTILAYTRTALTFFVAGLSFVQFFNSTVISVIGWIFTAAGIITAIIGSFRYGKMKKMISKIVQS